MIMSGRNRTKGRSLLQRIGLFLGPFLFIVFLLLEFTPGNPGTSRMAAVAALMSIWWITDALPLAATALLPLVLFPLLGILPGKETAPIYINSTIFLFIGGFMIALTMEKWKLHKRIALFIIRTIGGSPDRIVLGFMIAAAFLSMWISNTATAIMMVPIGLAIIVQMEERTSKEDARKFAVVLMLGIAYACSVGGVATLVGTPPNLSFVRIFAITFPAAPAISFGQWLMMGLPLSCIMLLLTWFLLVRVFYRISPQLMVDRTVVDAEYRGLGRISYEEKVVLIVFFLAAALWVFRERLDFGLFALPGWSQLLPYPDMIDDGTVALAMALVLFLVPTREGKNHSATVMSIDVFSRVPWHIVLLFGGGFALAKGFQVTGLSMFIGSKFAGFEGTPPLLLIGLINTGLTFMTELTSNTATTEMVLPILASVAVAMKINPLLLMVPATLSASHAFMMPVATPPNAIIFGSGRVKIIEMARVGFFINLIGIVVIGAVFYAIGTVVFSIDPTVFPEWAVTHPSTVGK